MERGERGEEDADGGKDKKNVLLVAGRGGKCDFFLPSLEKLFIALVLLSECIRIKQAGSIWVDRKLRYNNMFYTHTYSGILFEK